jgi:hypothetical protein
MHKMIQNLAFSSVCLAASFWYYLRLAIQLEFQSSIIFKKRLRGVKIFVYKNFYICFSACVHILK